MPSFTPDDIARMLVNPFYAVTVAPPLVDERRSASLTGEGVTDWLARNAATLGGPLGGDGHEAEEDWLRRLLDVLQHDPDAADPANPARAIAIAPIFAEEHPPLVTQEQWVRSNIKLMRELGAHAWLVTLLRVLQGDYVAAAEGDPEEEGDGAAHRSHGSAGQRPPSGRGRPRSNDPHARRPRRRRH
jgi:hypothetical protein